MFIAKGFYEHLQEHGCDLSKYNSSHEVFDAYWEWHNESTPDYFKVLKGKYAGSIGRLGFLEIQVNNHNIRLHIPKNMEWLPDYDGPEILQVTSDDKYKYDSNGERINIGDDVLGFMHSDKSVGFGKVVGFNGIVNCFVVATANGEFNVPGETLIHAKTDWSSELAKVTINRLSK